MGIEAVGIIPFQNEPTIEEVENTTALYLNEKLMKVEQDGNFYASNRYMLTYEELETEKEKKLVSEKFPDKNEFFKRAWLEDTENYLEYARVDVELLYRIDEEMALSEGILALQRLIIAPFDACFYVSNMGSIYFMRNAWWKAPTGVKVWDREKYLSLIHI